MKHYVYAHIRPDTNTIFHIGKGSKNRAFNFSKRNRHHAFIVAKYGCVVKILKYFEEEADALNYEKQLITEYKILGLCETNYHPGGAGGDTFTHKSEEDKLKFKHKMSEITSQRPVKCLRPLKGKDHPNFGNPKRRFYKHTEETKLKCSLSKIGELNPMKKLKGQKHHKFTGFYKTPKGIFESADAANIANNTRYSKYYCKISKSEKFKDWSFIPVKTLKESK